MEQPIKLLIVDDDPDIVTILNLRLKKRGYETETASNGNEALEKINTFTPDLLVMDFQMPGLTGKELLKVIRDNPKTTKLPIIFITGTYDISVLPQEPLVRALSKPCNIDDLILNIEDLLKKTT